MIDGKYATYQGDTYKVVEIISNEVVLVTEEAEALEKGFEAQTTNTSAHTLYFKRVARDDLDELYALYQEARYEGAIFDLYQDTEGQLYIGTEDQDKASTFGLEQTDEDYYSKYVTDDEIEKIIYRSHIE
ncbi:hypothetical protein CW746_12230 [Staphylococcus succinus]|uniref:hypothetical protein n=1 Tax=Staphylococcus succinus TaxID=61015 RepID=UPI000C33EDCE|nr:hypothetical protein [Staphylococcus succinus]MBU0436764.1 hypothetical protein [Staphylococcus succinus]MEB7462268.1 hypothetical protein [Staphylococcus succinus]PKI20127.1 hypothetical protein CW746_12230 [Staphylococcus succinus]PTI47072.1 hypothetical protein BU060_09220 [Staphylococcus succinus]PTJ85267.1 hypothetical protein BU055_01500 [Staphylococcus succinus]